MGVKKAGTFFWGSLKGIYKGLGLQRFRASTFPKIRVPSFGRSSRVLGPRPEGFLGFRAFRVFSLGFRL